MTEKKRGRGRPKIEIPFDIVENLAMIHCTVEEISAVTGVNKRTIERNCKEILAKGKAQGRASLRRFQWKAAKSGSVAMLIWLGKQLLGQRDNIENEAIDTEKLAAMIKKDVQKMRAVDKGES